MHWGDINKLFFNISKCNVMSFTKRKTPIVFPYTINNMLLNRPALITDLGVTFDSQLSFVPHVSKVVSSCFKTYGFIVRNTKQFNDSSTLILLFKFFVSSKLEYASVVWFPSYNTHIVSLERVQRKFLRFLCYREDGIYPVIGVSHKALLDRFNFFSCLDRVTCARCLFLAKLLRGDIDAPEILSKVPINANIRTKRLRQTSIFYLPAARTNVALFSPLHKMCALVNVNKNFDIFADSYKKISSHILPQSINSH